jgi:hypothetical protein
MGLDGETNVRRHRLDNQMRVGDFGGGPEHGLSLITLGMAFNGDLHRPVQEQVYGHGITGGKFPISAVGLHKSAKGAMDHLPVSIISGSVVKFQEVLDGGYVLRQRLFAYLQIAQGFCIAFYVEEASVGTVKKPFYHSSSHLFRPPQIFVIV